MFLIDPFNRDSIVVWQMVRQCYGGPKAALFKQAREQRDKSDQQRRIRIKVDDCY
jgi:hypothetical protein